MEPSASIRCPKCGVVFAAPAAWRLERCPACGTPVLRMNEDAAFD